MSGNAWEWVQDCWHDNYNNAPSNGSAWIANCSSDLRVLRGGSWSGDSVRASYRFNRDPFIRNSNIGFRVAQD